MIAFEQQRIPTKEKDEAWRRNMVDSLCARASEFGADWFRMWQNYRLKNNQIDQSEFREYCDTLGLDSTEGKKFVEPFNKTPTIIEVLKGEEMSMPWMYGVVNLASNSTNEVLRDKTRDIWDYVDNMLALEVEKQQQMAAIFGEVSNGSMSQQDAQKQMQAKEEEFKKKQDRLLKPSEIEAKYSKYKTLKEKTMEKLLRVLAINQNLKWAKNQTFEDALIAGMEAVEIEVDEFTGLPKVRQLNPLNLFFHKSPDTPFIQDSDYCGYKEEMAISDILDKYGHIMKDEDVKKLKTFNLGVYGINTPWHSDDGFSESHWSSLRDYEYTYQHPLATIPSTGTSNVLSDGLFASDRYRYKYENYAVIYTVYWKSQRRVGKMTYINDYGVESHTVVDEDFPIPSHAKKVNLDKRIFGKARTGYEWTSESGPVTLEWIWIPEIWKGVRINGNIHVYCEPYEHAYQSLTNPYRTKLPVYGFIYNNRNAFCISQMDKMKPWQKLYYVVASKWLKLISQDKGVIKLLNLLMMDKDLGYERTLQIAMDSGVLAYNPLAHSQGLGTAYSQKPAEALDLSNAQQLTYYTELLNFIENQIKLAAGVPESRLAQTSKSTNVSDNQRDMMQSMNITNSIFSAHDLLWQEVLQGLIETTVKTMHDKGGFIRNLLNDEEIALIDLGMLSLEDEYVVKIANNSKAFKMLQEAKALSQALIQNDKVRFSTLLNLMDTDSISEFKDELRGIEIEMEQREQQMQQMQQEHEKEMQKSAEEMANKQHQNELEIVRLKGEYDLMGEQIKSMAWNQDKDMNDNGTLDVYELEKVKVDLDMKRDKLGLENRKADQKDREMDMKESMQNLDVSSKMAMQDKELKAREALARIQAKNKAKQTK